MWQNALSLGLCALTLNISGCSEGDSPTLNRGTGGSVGTGGGSSSGGAGSGGATPSGGTSAGGSNGSGGVVVGTGGDPGTGGNSGTAPTNYDNGLTPTTITVEDARAAYDAWKEIHLEDCGGGVYRTRWENEKLDATVSEGIGYGMLLTVVWDDRAAFDGLYEYYKLGGNPETGLMNWLRYGCDAHYDEKYSGFPDGAAADADLDVAMSLIMADCKWGDGNYATEAGNVIRAIRDHMFVDDNGKHLLIPGDSGWYHEMGGGCVNYSYMAPAYYRAFAAYDGGNEAFWNEAADHTYDFLSAASDGATGLVRNWGSSGGGDATPDCHNAYNRSASYGDDAARTPWRIVTDYLWNGTPQAKAWNDKVTNWVASQGIASTVQWYHLDGSPDTEASTWEDHTAINVGPWAAGAMSLDQGTVDSFASELMSIPSGPSDHDGEYFPRMLKALSMATLAGKFTTCGGK